MPKQTQHGAGEADHIQPGAFGEWLKQVRSKRNLTLRALAEAAGVSVAAIWLIEAGKIVNPRTETKTRLAKALKAKLPADVSKKDALLQNVEGLGSLTFFDPYDIGDRPSAAGVYVFYDVSDRPVYIGQAQDIATRVKQHEQAFWFKSPIVSYAAYLITEHEKLRHQLEQVLIRFLGRNAVINVQGVRR